MFPPPLPTPRCFAALAIGSLGFLVAPWIGTAAWVVVIVVALLDSRRAGTLDRLELAFEMDPRASLGASVRAQIEVCAHAGAELTGSVALEFDSALASPDAETIHPVAIAGRETVAVPLRLGARRRGEHHVRAFHVLVRGPLGLADRRERRPFEAKVLVAPGLAAATRIELAHRTGRRMETGRHTTRQREDSGAFDSLREYQRGDDPRRIDWKASARRGSTVVRLMAAERRQDVVLAIDIGRSQRERFDDRERLDHALSAALCLAGAAGAFGDRIGVMAFAGKVVRLMPPAVRSLGSLAKEFALLESVSEEPDYKGALLGLAQRLPRRALVVVLSDAVDSEVSEPLIAGLRLLARRHLPLFVALRAPALEAAATRPLDRAEDVYLEAALIELARARAGALESLRMRGVRVLDVEAAEASPAVVAQYLRIKRQGSI